MHIGLCLSLKGCGRAGAAPFSPSDLAGMRLWLDASSSPLWQDAAGTVAATADSDPVRRWDDLSGQGRHMVAPSDASRPTLKLSQQAGKPALRFDGVDDYLRALFPCDFPSTIYAVVKQRTWVGGDYIFDNASHYAKMLVAQFGSSPDVIVYLAGVGTVTVSTFLLNQYHLLTASYWTAATKLRRNADAPGTMGGPGSGVTQPDGMTIAREGADYGTNLCAAIDLAELLLYGAEVGGEDDVAILTYLNTKWGVY